MDKNNVEQRLDQAIRQLEESVISHYEPKLKEKKVEPASEQERNVAQKKRVLAKLLSWFRRP